MNKLSKLVLTLLFVLVATFLAFWAGWLRTPTAEATCEHLIEIFEEEFGIFGRISIEECVKKYEKEEGEDLIPYAKYMRCLEDAEEYRDVQACEAKRSTAE